MDQFPPPRGVSASAEADVFHRRSGRLVLAAVWSAACAGAKSPATLGGADPEREAPPEAVTLAPTPVDWDAPVASLAAGTCGDGTLDPGEECDAPGHGLLRCPDGELVCRYCDLGCRYRIGWDYHQVRPRPNDCGYGLPHLTYRDDSYELVQVDDATRIVRRETGALAGGVRKPAS